MPVYNGEKYLDESIQSILNQTFKAFEFIIIDDKSTDGSLGVIKRYQKADDRIEIIENDKNLKIIKSLNKGIKKAKGKYIARQDADDISLPTRLEEQYNFLEKNKDIFLCGTDRIDIDEEGKSLGNTGKLITGYKKVKRVLEKRSFIIHTSIMFRNQGFTYREKSYHIEDYDFYLILLSRGLKLDNLNKKLVKYRITPESITITKRAIQCLFTKKVRDFYKQRIKTGKDEYDKFNPEREILKITPDQVLKASLQLKMRFYFKKRDFNAAKKVFLQYQRLDSVSFFDALPDRLCVQLPFIYKLYRLIRYGEKI